MSGTLLKPELLPLHLFSAIFLLSSSPPHLPMERGSGGGGGVSRKPSRRGCLDYVARTDRSQGGKSGRGETGEGCVCWGGLGAHYGCKLPRQRTVFCLLLGSGCGGGGEWSKVEGHSPCCPAVKETSAACCEGHTVSLTAVGSLGWGWGGMEVGSSVLEFSVLSSFLLPPPPNECEWDE